ncbi:LysR family transcriptional regulator [Cellulomonas sp. Root137]|uniref:LysR family transcriptional regulator n=1 Tax=Cellulomonas sp. Root137 TaxID=1736459 RepID=UPI001910F033|nr:LysR family transcriptional regulator [Cellulomonas sp. Root137]
MLELRLLAALNAVARTGTFGAAAAELGYTQSTLSQQVAALERRVGGAVFDRPGGARRPRITPLGRLVLTQARTLLAADVAARDAIDRFHAGAGRVDVGTFQTVTNVLLPMVVDRLRVEHPDADIRLFEDETDEPPIDLLDLAFLDVPGPDDADHVEVFRDEHVVVARRGAFPPGPVPLADLHGRAMVALPPICDQAVVEAALARAAVAPDIVFRTVDNQGITSMVRAGLGAAVMPVLSVWGQRHDDALSFHRLEPAVPDRVVQVVSRGTLSPLAIRLRELSVEAGQHLVRDLAAADGSGDIAGREGAHPPGTS